MAELMVFPIDEPSDGWTSFEKFFLRQTIVSMYQRITDPMDKFITIAIFEAGYTQQDCADIFGISQVAIHNRMKKISAQMRILQKKGEL